MAASDTPRLTVIGGGNMGTAIIGGLLAAGWSPATIRIVEPFAPRRAQLATDLPAVAVVDALPPTNNASDVPRPTPAKAAGGAETAGGAEEAEADTSPPTPGGLGDVLLAVKPHVVPAALAEAAAAGATRVLSIAAGVSRAALATAAGPGVKVIRAMPNTPAMVGAGASAVVTDDTDEADLAWAEEILGAVGTVVRVPESSIDAVTGLSGSGPAYVFLVAEALTEAGVLLGLPRPTAAALTAQTLMGAGRLLTESGQDPATLRANVTSPGGTTAAGLATLEDHATRAAFIQAVKSAATRSSELA